MRELLVKRLPCCKASLEWQRLKRVVGGMRFFKYEKEIAQGEVGGFYVSNVTQGLA